MAARCRHHDHRAHNGRDPAGAVRPPSSRPQVHAAFVFPAAACRAALSRPAHVGRQRDRAAGAGAPTQHATAEPDESARPRARRDPRDLRGNRALPRHQKRRASDRRADAFTEAGVAPDLKAPVHFVARAITPPGRTKRFDTRFFAVDAGAIAVRREGVVGPDTELTELVWLPIDEASRTCRRSPRRCSRSSRCADQGRLLAPTRCRSIG